MSSLTFWYIDFFTSVDEGSIKTANNLKIGYLSQHEFESDNNDTLLNTIREKVNVSEGQARHILANFMFYGKDVFKMVNEVSLLSLSNSCCER